jgi:hypothetical protein
VYVPARGQTLLTDMNPERLQPSPFWIDSRLLKFRWHCSAVRLVQAAHGRQTRTRVLTPLVAISH